MVLGLFKKKEVPYELPDLATDKILEKELEKDKKVVAESLKEKEPDVPLKEERKEEAFENGYFAKLQGELNKEFEDLSRIESWYKEKMEGKDIVAGMKDYWKNDSAVLANQAGKEIKEKISKKTLSLQALEKEWQESYISLLEKEDRMKKEEEELKKMLSEFVEVYKAHKKRRKA